MTRLRNHRHLLETKYFILELIFADHNSCVKLKKKIRKLKCGGGQPLYAAAADVKVLEGFVITKDGMFAQEPDITDSSLNWLVQ